jgi:hypothetical protein
MFRKFNTPMKSVVALSLVLVFALSAAWALQTYNASIIVKKGGVSDRLMLVAESENGTVNFRIKAGALDDYLTEQGKDKVKITVEMIEDEANGVLLFTFGPSGTYFNPPSKLKLRGNYIYDNHLLVDENGELIEYTVAPKKDLLVFDILHFSSYYYDSYDSY